MTLLLKWTDEREARLRELHEKGLSASQIAHDPRAARKNSRNKASGTIVSKTIFRIIEGGFGSTRVSRSIEKSQKVDLRCAEVISRDLPIEQWQDSDCRWIEGDDHLACGHPKATKNLDGKEVTLPYCGHHSAIAFITPKPPKHTAYVGPMARVVA
jgi:hypothetical protein